MAQIEVVAGGMFSGKTEELLRRFKRAQYAKLQPALFKPKTDNRYSKTSVVSHSGFMSEAIVCEKSSDILKYVMASTQFVGIDEAQFFDGDIVDVCEYLAKQGVRVVLAGLDMDSRGEPFGPMPRLLSIAESVTKLRAICTVCGTDAGFSYRLQKGEGQILVGGESEYEARCRIHFEPR